MKKIDEDYGWWSIINFMYIIAFILFLLSGSAQADEYYNLYEPEDQWVEVSEPSSDGIVDLFNIETGELTQEEIIQVTPYSDIDEVETYDPETGKITIWGRNKDR
ncbi:MAG: hypothetical protein GOV02_00780 [Candidatus Aenigmarchaeota archaeon]|nr:hypothetical protein [Candidatus Aenigmarchaeota archaeon]